jgi:uncharacterized membrane protein
LRIGMYASFAMMVVGQVWWLLSGSPGGDVVENIAIPVDRIVPELFSLNPLALTSLGVVALLLTPGLTLFTSAMTYARTRAWLFAGLSAFLALVLTFGDNAVARLAGVMSGRYFAGGYTSSSNGSRCSHA